MSPFCTKCGRELREGYPFCSGCGADVGGRAEAEEPTEVEPTPLVTPAPSPDAELRVQGPGECGDRRIWRT